MRTPIAHPLPVLGTILVHKSDGSTVLLPASSECFDPNEINAVRKLIDLVPIEGEPTPVTLAHAQKETVRSSVAIRSTPGFMNCGYESVEIESKDERIVRLEQANKALTKWMDATIPLVGDTMEAFADEPEMKALRDRMLATLEKKATQRVQSNPIKSAPRMVGNVVSPNGCEVVR